MSEDLNILPFFALLGASGFPHHTYWHHIALEVLESIYLTGKWCMQTSGHECVGMQPVCPALKTEKCTDKHQWYFQLSSVCSRGSVHISELHANMIWETNQLTSSSVLWLGVFCLLVQDKICTQPWARFMELCTVYVGNFTNWWLGFCCNILRHFKGPSFLVFAYFRHGQGFKERGQGMYK